MFQWNSCFLADCLNVIWNLFVVITDFYTSSAKSKSYYFDLNCFQGHCATLQQNNEQSQIAEGFVASSQHCFAEDSDRFQLPLAAPCNIPFPSPSCLLPQLLPPSPLAFQALFLPSFQFQFAFLEGSLCWAPCTLPGCACVRVLDQTPPEKYPST